MARTPEQARAWYLKNTEAVKRRSSERYHRLGKVELERRREFRRRNRERVLAQKLRYRQARRAELVKKALAWKQANPDRWAHNIALERARRFKVDITLTVTEWMAIVAHFGHRCAYCQRQGKCGIDHLVPLERGGPHSLENTVPACGKCNASKRNRTPLEWILSGAPRARLIGSPPAPIRAA